MKEFCSNVDVLKAIRLINNIYNIILIVVPSILIIVIMKSLFQAVLSNDDKYKEVMSSAIKKFIIAMAVFFLPNLIINILSFSMNGLFNADFLCLNEATDENINALQIIADAEREKEYAERQKQIEEARLAEKLRQSEQRFRNYENTQNPVVVPSPSKEYRGSEEYKSKYLTPFVNGVQRALKPGDCMSWEDNCFCPTNGTYKKSFQFIMESETGRKMKETSSKVNSVKVQETCSDGHVYKVHVLQTVADKYAQALKNLCTLRTTGINGYKIYDNVDWGGDIVTRTNSARTICSPHSYGTAVDYNYAMTIVVNGVEYKPYAGQGDGTKANYDAFVRALGKELDERNVNYIMWKFAFEPAGFDWGGTWSSGSFDPMHFEVA